MDFSDFDSVIQFAIEREEEAINRYGELQKKAKTPGLKELLSDLQSEEMNHKRLLQGLDRKILETGSIPRVDDMKISDYLVEEPLEEDMKFQDILIFAAKKEQKAVELYSDLAERAKSEEIKRLFQFLVAQEKSHKLRLESEYETRVLEGY